MKTVFIYELVPSVSIRSHSTDFSDVEFVYTGQFIEDVEQVSITQSVPWSTGGISI